MLVQCTQIHMLAARHDFTHRILFICFQALSTAAHLYSDDIKRENIPISRYPIPDRSTLPQAVQDRMNDVEEKVSLPALHTCTMYIYTPFCGTPGYVALSVSQCLCELLK